MHGRFWTLPVEDEARRAVGPPDQLGVGAHGLRDLSEGLTVRLAATLDGLDRAAGNTQCLRSGHLRQANLFSPGGELTPKSLPV